MKIPDETYIEHFKDKFNLRVKKVSGGYEVSGYYITLEEGVRELLRIGRLKTNESYQEWVVYGVEMIPGTMFEPEDADEVELSREKTLGDALKKVLMFELSQKIDESLENINITADLEMN